MQKLILLVEDDELERGLYCRILQSEGYTVLEAHNLKTANEILKREYVPVIIIDVKLPDGNGLDFVTETKKQFSGVEIIVFTGYGSINDGVQAMKNGAFDYIIKGEAAQKLINLTGQAMAKALSHFVVKPPAPQANDLKDFNSIIGESAIIKKIKSIGLKVALTNANVLLLGETGVGKDIFAEAIHYSSKRSRYPFVAINCSAIAQEMLESELFGYKSGAFTGALKDKKGLFEEAHGGTIFLDEIGEMSINLQAKLLRVLENKTFIKLGDTKTSFTDFRLIAATHVNLLDAIKTGKFREDLYYRISSFIINIPPLRDRNKDISLLANHYIHRLSEKMKIPEPKMSNSFVHALDKHQWPGNVRELINVIERAIILSSGELTPDLVEFPEENTSYNLYSLEYVEIQHIKKILNECKGNKRKAARKLGISVATLYRKIGLEDED